MCRTRQANLSVKRWWLLCILWLSAVAAPAAELPSRAKASSASSEMPAVTLRGHVVCVTEETHRVQGIQVPSGHPHVWGLRATNRELYTIKPGRYAEAIFQDERVRAKELQVRVHLMPTEKAIEVLTVYTVKNGVVHDLYYYCDICAIKSVSPEICACCQGPVELTEKPLSQRED